MLFFMALYRGILLYVAQYVLYDIEGEGDVDIDLRIVGTLCLHQPITDFHNSSNSQAQKNLQKILKLKVMNYEWILRTPRGFKKRY
jgi:hypothetical protein